MLISLAVLYGEVSLSLKLFTWKWSRIQSVNLYTNGSIRLLISPTRWRRQCFITFIRSTVEAFVDVTTLFEERFHADALDVVEREDRRHDANVRLDGRLERAGKSELLTDERRLKMWKRCGPWKMWKSRSRCQTANSVNVSMINPGTV